MPLATLLLAELLMPAEALAYVGPGLGLGAPGDRKPREFAR